MSTIKVDTVRPVTADASLTLQGDNSGTGVSGITIDSSGNATFAGTGNNVGTVTAGTIGSSVVFPSGVVIGVDFYQELTSSGNQTSDYGWGTVRSVTLTSGQKCLIHISGGGMVSNDATDYTYSAIQYDTTTLTTSSQGTFAYGGLVYVDDLSVAANDPRIIVGSMVTHLYTAASNVTLYFRPAIHYSAIGTGNASWFGDSDRPINITLWKIA
jgi:hypothetical protein